MMEVVNGYACKTCTDVEYAKKGVDPAKPKDAPNEAGRAEGAERSKDAAKAERGPAVGFSGALANVTPPPSTEKGQPYKPGSGFTFTA